MSQTQTSLSPSQLHGELSQQPQLFGHPIGLYVLFATEMWERFTFYGMRGLLVLFMTNHLRYGDDEANLIYGAFQSLVYMLPLIGGLLADKLLGHRRCIYFGGVTMALGTFMLASPVDWLFYLGMGFIACGNCYFKPNISTLVGDLYPPNDARRDGAFTIFYAGINIGALGGGALCGWVAYAPWGGMRYGFALAGVFLLLGLVLFTFGKKYLPGLGHSPAPEKLFAKSALGISVEHTIYILSLLCTPVIAWLLANYKILDYVFNPMALAALVYLLYLAFSEKTRTARNKLLCAIVLIVFSVLFWGFYEQGGGSLNLYTERNVDLDIGGVQFNPASVNNSLNPLMVILMSPLFAVLWAMLDRRQRDLGVATKFALGLLLLGIGYGIFALGSRAAMQGIVPLWYLVLGYVFLSAAELCLSPVGLSMITNLSPAKLVGVMMGAWFLASGMGQYVAGQIGALTAMPSGQTTGEVDPTVSLPIYTSMFEYIAIVSLVAFLILAALSPLLNRWAASADQPSPQT